MSALGIILRSRTRAARNTLAEVRNQSLLKLLVITTVGGGLWALLFAGSWCSLRFLSDFPGLRDDVIFTMLSLMFMALTLLLIFSSIIYSFGSLFRSKEAEFLLSKPIPAGSIYAYKTVEGLVFGSWAFLVMGLPPMMAYGIDVGANAWYYLGLPLFFFPFALMTSALGTLAGLAITVAVPRRRKTAVTALVVLVAVLAALTARDFLESTSGTSVTDLWKERVLGHLSFLRNRYFPHLWMTRGMLFLAAGRPVDAILPLLSLISMAGFSYLGGDFIARRFYGRVYAKASTGSGHRSFRPSLAGRLTETLALPAGRITAVFVSKDVKVFLRDPAQWSQVLIFFGLLAVYIVNLRSLRIDMTRGFWLFLVSTLNLGAMSLTLATLTTRFVYPQMSLEGRRFWVLGLAPVRRRDVLFGKFVFSLGGALVVSQGLINLSNLMLRMPAEVFVFQSIAVVLVCVGLTGLAAGMGAMFPEYGQTNPSRIVSGFGGTLTLVLSVAFVTAMVVLVGALSYYRLVDASLGPMAFRRWAGIAVIAGTALTAVCAGVPLVHGARRLESAEF